MITNLLTNAIHYNKDGGEIRVSVQQGADQTMLAVADTGQGISAEDLPHIFERFWRADQARSHAGGRTGLGLATVYGIAKQHQGWIELSSELNVGTTFRVFLPRSARIPEFVSEIPTAPQVGHGRKETILLVEDEPMLADAGATLAPAGGAWSVTLPPYGSGIWRLR